MNPGEIARALGRRGGRARASRMPAAERQRIASLGGQARRESGHVARRIIDNLRYAAAMVELRGNPTTVRRTKGCNRPLPRIDHAER